MFSQLVNQMPYQDMRKSSDTLSFWLFIAAVVHAIVLMGVTFVPPKPLLVGKTIEVTIVNSATKKAPENAKYFAQANQIAAGLETQKPLPVAKKEPSAGHDLKKQHQVESSETQKVIEHRLITQKNAEEKLDSAAKRENNPDTGTSEQSQPEMSIEELDKQIALIEVKLQQQKENSEKTNIKSFNAISAHKQVAAQYIKDWERKVERIGNLNYPEINGKQDFSGTLSMDVGIRYDGVIYDIKIVKSSGIPELDKAAEQIVIMSAPFAPLPESITREAKLDVLQIRRVWSFSEEGNTITSSEIIN